jgi:putative transposase
VLRQGAQRLLTQAIEAEIAVLLAQYADRYDPQDRQAVVRNGYLPEREVQTGIGAVRVKEPRVRDRSGLGIRFHSALLPPYIRRSKRLEALLPWLYLKGVSTEDFSEAFPALLGPEAPGLSPATISRLKQGWHEELTQWQRRSLKGKRYTYFWVDGVYFETRLAEAWHCILVIIGADASGYKELVGLWDGYRESEQSWQELLLDLKSHGLEHGSALALGDGVLGFWKALRQVYGQPRRQRCWVHKTANVLDTLPKALQPRAKQRPQAIWMAPDRQRAELAFDVFIATYGGEVSEGGQVPGSRLRGVIGVLCFPRRALGAHPDDQSDRIDVCHCTWTHRQDPRRPLPRHEAGDGVQTCIRVPPSDGIGYGPRITCKRSCRAWP